MPIKDGCWDSRGEIKGTAIAINYRIYMYIYKQNSDKEYTDSTGATRS